MQSNCLDGGFGAIGTAYLRNRSAHGFHQHLHIVPDIFLGIRITQQVCGVVGGNDFAYALVVVYLLAEFADANVAVQHRLGRDEAQAADEPGPNDGELPFEEAFAVDDLVGQRLAVAWRTALDDVTDVDFFPRQFAGGDDLIEELPRCTNEGLACFIFVSPGSFTHEDEFGLNVADAEDSAGAIANEFGTLGAALHFVLIHQL